MSDPGPVAVTGAGGRLGQALMRTLQRKSITALAWSRPEYDLDDVTAAGRLMKRDTPAVVIHAAAWTDVDGCAGDPALAMRRNADAARELAQTCISHGARMVLVSTNEVFDGERADGLGYSESDTTNPRNAYGASKSAGETAASEAFAAANRADGLLIARTAWLFGPPGGDFPTKIIAASDALPTGQPLRVVADEIGSPTYSVDLAEAIVRLLLAGAAGGTYHLVNEGRASRLELAQRVLGRCRPERALAPISRTEFVRASVPPAWAVLSNTRAAAMGVVQRSWQEAVDGYVPSLCAA